METKAQIHLSGEDAPKPSRVQNYDQNFSSLSESENMTKEKDTPEKWKEQKGMPKASRVKPQPQQLTVTQSTQKFSFGLNQEEQVSGATAMIEIGDSLPNVGERNEQKEHLQQGFSNAQLSTSSSLQQSFFDASTPMSTSQQSFVNVPMGVETNNSRLSLLVRGVSTESYEKFNGYTKKPQFPRFKLPENFEVTSLLEALRSEPKVKNPDSIYSMAMESVSTIKENKTLDKYILSDEEAATLCAFPLLMEAGLDFNAAIESYKERLPSKLFVLLLKSLRKLPQTRAVFYFGVPSTKQVEKGKNSYLQHNFVMASKNMQIVKETLEKNKESNKEIFRVEGGWGYDVADFMQVSSKNEEILNDFIILEPWRVFSVADSGVKNEDSGISVVLLNFVDEKLMYEKEIKPGMLQYIIPMLGKNQRYLKILSEMTLDKRNCKDGHTKFSDDFFVLL